jgi:hypothetical protein
VSYRRTLIFFIIFAALATFFYLHEFRGEGARRESERKALLLFSFTSEDVVALILQKPEQSIVVEKVDDTWNIREPVTAPAERKIIDRILETLQELRYERDIGPQDALEPFGLSEPETAIELTGTQGSMGRLLLGAATRDGKSVYVQRAPDRTVFTVPKSTREEVDRSLFDLRDKTVFDFSTPDVMSLSIHQNGRTILFENRSEDGWTITSPAEHRADTVTITGLLDSIRYGRIRKFVEEEASDMQQYGLENPASHLKLTLRDETRTLSFGKRIASEPGLVYARRGERQEVVELGDEILTKLSADVNDWRSRRLVKVDSAKVRSLQIDSDAGRIAVERSTEEPEEWRLTRPGPAVADRERMAALLSDLQNAKIARFLTADKQKAAESAFVRPLVRVTLNTEDAESPLNFLLAGSEEEPQLYARTGEGGEIFEVDKGLLETFLVEPKEMRDKSVLRFKEADIEKFEVVSGKKLLAMERKNVEWNVSGSPEMESYEIDQFLWDLRRLKYETIEPEKDDASYGFDSPTMTIKLWSSGRDGPQRLIVGKRTAEQNSYYLLRSDDRQIMRAEGTLISEWLDRL